MGDAAEDAERRADTEREEEGMPPATRARKAAEAAAEISKVVLADVEVSPEDPERPPLGPGASIQQRMIAVIGELPALGKDDYNKQQQFHFRSHDSVMTALNPLLAKHGVFIVPDVVERITDQRTTGGGKTMYEVNLHVRFTFWGAAGDFVEASAWGEGTDMGDKATNKAMTAAFKYCIVQAFAIASAESADSDRETNEETTRGGSRGREQAKPKVEPAKSWGDWKSRMAQLGVSPEDSTEWLRQASEHLDLTTKEGKDASWAIANLAMFAITEMDTDLAFDENARSKIQTAFASALDGRLIEGPFWRVAATEEDRPSYDEYVDDQQEQEELALQAGASGPIEDEVLPGTAAAAEGPEQAEGYDPDIGF